MSAQRKASTLFDVPISRGDRIVRDARFTKSGRRFLLTRRWNGAAEDAPYVLFVMLNPSTANATTDDPTIRKVMKYTRSWGFHHLRVMNLFDYVTPSPNELLAWWLSQQSVEQARVHEPLDLGLMRDESAGAQLTICAWGAIGAWFPERVRQVIEVLKAPHALHITKDGSPGHPLYLPAGATPTPYAIR